MRLLGVLILAGVVPFLGGCRADKASQAASELDARVSVRQPAATEPSAEPPAAADNRPLIVCFGDSLTAGYGEDPGASYPDYLQKDLDAEGYRYRVVNEGVSGNTSKDGVERLAGIVAMKPAVVVVEFGGNDGLRGLKTETTRDNLAKILSGLKAAGTKVVIAGISLPPDYGPDYVKAFTANYSSLGKQFNLPVLPFLLQNVYGVEGMMQGDRTHATARGNEVVAKNVLPYVTPLLRK
ncbi:acyl-CoA thioesterase-1 [Granulicella pectinivorans]|uniref:Acyl-CoA thioesterase-1 n=1 Tax=Granulicella pectinivorans TaxID=474950 RepID=A0A1I6M2F4_9BACT|nr:arylesterase [Granulicella pectinivorans]SFS09897.1 acyl-CoA thioesterase-1 [Granulicella pectinivorans]